MSEDEEPRTPQARAPQASQASQASQAVVTDREDLLTILALRFGVVPDEVRARIAACDDLGTLERLILVAANVADWEVFLDELASGSDEFKVVGERFDPLSSARRSPPGGAAQRPSSPRPEARVIQIRRPKHEEK